MKIGILAGKQHPMGRQGCFICVVGILIVWLVDEYIIWIISTLQHVTSVITYWPGKHDVVEIIGDVRILIWDCSNPSSVRVSRVEWFVLGCLW